MCVYIHTIGQESHHIALVEASAELSTSCPVATKMYRRGLSLEEAAEGQFDAKISAKPRQTWIINKDFKSVDNMCH